jgi:diguanylate cyclase (GGDEF)-like protein
MKAVAAARQLWALRRPQARAGAQPGRERRPAAPITRALMLSLVLLAAATVACAAVGLAVTQYNDQRMVAERHLALARALDELHAAVRDNHRFDDRQVRLIERRSELADLRFSADPPLEPGREIQSLQDAQGRIVGWFSWVPDRGMILAMDWLWGFAGALAAVIVLLAVLARRATQRLARLLAGANETVRKLTGEDAVTGLSNQRAVLDSLNRALAGRGSGQVVLALLDLDGLREANDTLGRKGGDALVVAITGRLNAILPQGALLGRFEDDEFAVIASGQGADTADALCDALTAAFAEPFVMAGASAGQGWTITACIGVAQAPDDGRDAEELTRRAALALRAAKREGHGTLRRFAPQIETEQADRRFLLRELKNAITQQSFAVHYQPIVAADGSGIVGVEALARWNHPQRGEIAPSVFIPLAEQNGLMGELGAIVLRRALADAVRWPSVFVAVNLSPLQIRDPKLVSFVAAVMKEAGIKPSRVVLEMTEGILIDDPEETLTRLQALRALGVSIALDDFGAGYSSLSYLQKFPFQRLKIDRAFVASLGLMGNAGAIIQSIVTLGHALGMSVLAEGIETDEQRVLLRLAGCDEMQGYLFAQASPAVAIDALLLRRAGKRAAAEQGEAAAR